MGVSNKNQKKSERNENKIKKIFIIILIMIILAVCGFKIYSITLKKLYPVTYSDYVSEYSNKYGIEKNWIFALIKAESNFDEKIVSQSGAVRSYASYGKNRIRSCRKYWKRDF